MITLEKAQTMSRAALSKAKELGITISVEIVDSNGNTLVLERMEKALSISPKFAHAKAYTSGTLGLATSDMAAYAVPGKPYYGMDSIFGGELTTIAGGLPIKEGGNLIGGIGVGGSSDVAQDVECAQAGVEAFN